MFPVHNRRHALVAPARTPRQADALPRRARRQALASGNPATAQPARPWASCLASLRAWAPFTFRRWQSTWERATAPARAPRRKLRAAPPRPTAAGACATPCPASASRRRKPHACRPASSAARLPSLWWRPSEENGELTGRTPCTFESTPCTPHLCRVLAMKQLVCWKAFWNLRDCAAGGPFW